MVDVFAICGKWISNDGLGFAGDEERGGRLLVLEGTTTIEELKNIVSKDFKIDQGHDTMEFSYIPQDLINNSGCPLVIISNDRQVRNFVAYVTKKPSTQLCVTMKPKVDFVFNKEPEKTTKSGSHVSKKKKPEARVEDDMDDVLLLENGVQGNQHVALLSVDNVAKKGQWFNTKRVMKARMEMCAMKHKFHYEVVKSTTEWWNIRWKDNLCNWRLRARNVSGYTVFKVTKYVSTHTCAPSSKTKGGKTASAKTIATLIMPKYQGAKDGPPPIDIMQYMLLEQGVNISYSLAFDAHEYAVNTVRGISKNSYEKIPTYLYMLQAANLGTYYSFEIDGMIDSSTCL